MPLNWYFGNSSNIPWFQPYRCDLKITLNNCIIHAYYNGIPLRITICYKKIYQKYHLLGTEV